MDTKKIMSEYVEEASEKVGKRKRGRNMTKKQRKEALKNALADNIEAEEVGGGDPVPATDEQRQHEADAERAQAQAEEEARIDYLHRFYDYSGDRQGNLKIEIDIVGVLDILRELGFCRYDQPDGSIEYVRIKDYKIKLIKNQQEIIDAFEDYVAALPDRYVSFITNYNRDGDATFKEEVITGDKLRRKLFKNIGYYFGSLPRLRPDHEIRVMHDTPKSKYIYYENGVVRISADGVKFFKYSDLLFVPVAAGEDNGEYVWEHDILKRNYIPLSTITGDFRQFCMYICGLTGTTPSAESVERFLSLQSIFGYLLHDNYECNLKSILFIDVNKNSPDKPTGGTGKGIIGKALKHMVNREPTDCKYIAVGGKGFDPKFDRRYSEGDVTTKIVHIEDIARDFEFEEFFNDVTDGAEFRKAGGNSTHHLCKTMLSSNIPIDTSSVSFRRRLVIFELDNYFNSVRTPVDVFGKRFFESSWTAQDWAEFDNFMIGCCYYYMQTKDTANENGKVTGIKEPPQINYKQQLLRSKLSVDFIKWFEDLISEAVLHLRTTEYVKTKLFDDFSQKYQEYSSREKYSRAFTRWCKFYLETMEIPSGEKRSTQDLLILYPPKNDDKIDYIIL